MIYSKTGDPEDGAWELAVGNGSSSMSDAPLMPNGFDGVSGAFGFGSNIGANLHTYDEALYAGTIMVINATLRPLPAGPVFDGADIWRATGPAKALVWARVTGNGFGDPDLHHFDSFCTYNGSLYAAASNFFGSSPQQRSTTGNPQGGKVYRLAKVPQFVSACSITISLDVNRAPVIAWTTEVESDLMFFNVYRSDSEALKHSYILINSNLIQATGSGSTYVYIDTGSAPGSYYYKIEVVKTIGEKNIWSFRVLSG